MAAAKHADEREDLAVEERGRFKFLIAQNPNYFGNLEDSQFEVVKKLVSSTVYEELTCVGYNPEKGLLEATIAIKRATGYSGDLCHTGSTEFVRFFVDAGSGWQDVGVTGVKVHDIPTEDDCSGASEKPLSYVATLAYNPKGDCCDDPSLPNVRAILSWQWEPPAGNANWQPPWGGRHECHVQIRPKPWNLSCLFDDLHVKIPGLFEQVKELPIPQPDPAPFAVAELAKMYAPEKGGKGARAAAVPSHRFGMNELHLALSVGSFDEQLFSGKKLEWEAVDLDWVGSLVELDKTKANVDFEQLECLGMDEVFPERLVATFRIRRPFGYNGDLCHKGSLEHIAFWADWEDTCEWTYLGTQTVNVHDIESIPDEGLCYSVVQPVDLGAYRKKCRTPVVGRVRAVLSWNVPPSTTDPEDLQHYGNRVDAHVLVEPREIGDPFNARIRNIGGIPVEDIDTTSGTGTGRTKAFASGGGSVVFAHSPVHMADGSGLNRACPFGGIVWVEGVDFHYPNYYRVKVRKDTDHSVVMAVTNDFLVERTTSGFDHQVATGEWFRYLPGSHMNRLLTYWNTSGDEKWEVQLDIASAPNDASILSSSPWYLIQLDNTAPAPPGMDLHLTSVGDCDDVVQGATIEGRFVADDLHFGSWSLATEPNTPATPSTNPQVSGLASTSPAPGPVGHDWTLDTSLPLPDGMHPCGYVVRLVVTDRSIVNSLPGQHNQNHTSVGFCLREQGA